MKNIATLLVFGMSALCFGQGQVEMNDTAHANYYKSQQIKDTLVIELIKANSNDSLFIKNFEDSERLWNTFVDHQFRLKFSAYKSWETRREIYGSQFDMLYYNFLKLYCDLRINTIRDLIEDN